jgi:hypothetical protein
LTSPGIKAAPLAFLLDRIVRDDESGAEAALRIVRQVRQRGCMMVSVRDVLAERLAGNTGHPHRVGRLDG